MDYRKSRAWQRADDLAVQVYEASRKLPKEEVYGFTAQIRRAAISVAANIAEGSGRSTKKDFLHFLYQARGSSREVEYYVHLAQRLSYLEAETTNRLRTAVNETGRALYGLINHWKERDTDTI
ncbi:MAG: four helix bundle protein [Anaerolineales bacterium]|nr:MAG: four helix bundle protein [Anaerolineales bacterium]